MLVFLFEIESRSRVAGQPADPQENTEEIPETQRQRE